MRADLRGADPQGVRIRKEKVQQPGEALFRIVKAHMIGIDRRGTDETCAGTAAETLGIITKAVHIEFRHAASITRREWSVEGSLQILAPRATPTTPLKIPSFHGLRG